jgi:hypothetical protein
MSMDIDLRARLLAVPALTALVADRVSWDERSRFADQLAPCITLTVIVQGRDYTHEGAMELHYPWVQADVWAGSGEDVDAVAALLITIMETKPFVIAGATKFEPAFVEGDRTMPNEILPGGAVVRRRSIDFRFYHEPAV